MAFVQPIGELDRLVTLQSPSTTRDPVEGDLVPGWDWQGDVWAKLIERQVAGSEQAGQQTMMRSTTLRIRYRADVLASWRVLLDARVLQITGTLERGRREYLDLMCAEVTGG